MLQHIVYKRKTKCLRKLKTELKKWKRNKNKILKHFDDKNLHDLKKKKYCYLMYTAEFPLQKFMGVTFTMFTEIHGSDIHHIHWSSFEWNVYGNKLILNFVYGYAQRNKNNHFLNASMCSWCIKNTPYNKGTLRNLTSHLIKEIKNMICFW